MIMYGFQEGCIPRDYEAVREVAEGVDREDSFDEKMFVR